MHNSIPLALLLITVCYGCTKTDSREAELGYLRTTMPNALLKYVHREEAPAGSIDIS